MSKPLIPQQPPFVLVDTLVEASPSQTRTTFTIPASHVLVERSRLSAEGLVENMAQTCAAGAGQRNADDGTAPRPGFIGAVKKLEIKALPKVGETITTTVVPRHEVGGASIVAASVAGAEGQVLASAELTIFLHQ